VELCGPDDEALKYQLLLDAATRYEAGLGDRREAIQVLTEALELRPADAEVVGRLDRLYTAERMWPELLDNLRLQAAAAGDPAVRLALKGRIARLLAGELDDARQALEAYHEVLDAGYDESAARAIRELGESRDELRLDAASALEPVLRSAGKHAELLDTLEMRLRAQSEPADRARTLRSLAEVAERSLGDASRAEGALLRALGEEPSSAGLHAEIERLADSLGADGWHRYADALAERAGAIFDVELATDLYVRLGRVADAKLRDEGRAAAAYVAAAERAGDTPQVLGALDRLYGNLGDTRALADVLERRIAIEAEAAAQADLYHRLAVLQIKSLGEPGQGLTLLRQALERVHDHARSREALEALLEDGGMFDDAFEALEWVYRTLGKSQDLARLYDRKVGRAQGPGERTRARLDLARVLEAEVHDGAQAQRVIEAAVLDDPSDQDALAELYRLATANQAFQDASQALARALGSAKDLSPATASELWIRLAGWRRDKLGDAAGAEEALTEALRLDAESLTILRALEDLRRGPGRERDLVETLRTRAKLETDLEAKRAALREAKALAETTLRDTALAEATLRDLLHEDEADAWGLEELTRLREAAGDFAEVVTLLLRRAELAADGADALALKKRAAEVLTDKIGDLPRAIALYEDVLDSEPTDATAAGRLRGLYGQARRDRDLGKLLERLIDVATSPRERSVLRMELAKLEEEKFAAPDDAVDTLRAVIEEEPGNQDAILALSALLEKTGKDAELAELLKSQLEAAKERGDTGAELGLLVRLGEVYETRLEDAAAAQATYEAVLERDPSHRGALEATARLSERRDAWSTAAGALAKLVELSADATGLPFALRLAAAREKLGDSEGVEEALKLALKLEPANREVRTQLQALYEKGKKWVELADLLVGDAELLAAANPVAAAPPPAPTPSTRSVGSSASVPPPATSEPVLAQVNLLRRAAEIHSEKRKSPADAIPILERAAALVPHDRQLLLVMCDAYNAAKRERDAAKVLEQVIASFGNKRTKELSLYHHRLGRALAQLGDRDVALTHYDMAFKIDPGSVLVLRDLGVLAFETNDLERAQKTFRALLLQRLDGTTGISKGEVFYYLGEISARQGDKEKARTMFERAIENEPTLERAKTKLLELKG
jgi:tetratricopeptide (TPR) repeat protein